MISLVEKYFMDCAKRLSKCPVPFGNFDNFVGTQKRQPKFYDFSCLFSMFIKGAFAPLFSNLHNVCVCVCVQPQGFQRLPFSTFLLCFLILLLFYTTGFGLSILYLCKFSLFIETFSILIYNAIFICYWVFKNPYIRCKVRKCYKT